MYTIKTHIAVYKKRCMIVWEFFTNLWQKYIHEVYITIMDSNER